MGNKTVFNLIFLLLEEEITAGRFAEAFDDGVGAIESSVGGCDDDGVGAIESSVGGCGDDGVGIAEGLLEYDDSF